MVKTTTIRPTHLQAGSPRAMAKQLQTNGYDVAEYAIRQWLADGTLKSARAGRNYVLTYQSLLDLIHGRANGGMQNEL